MMEQAVKNGELRVLMLEDTATDAELAEHELRKAGLVYAMKRVETREAFLRALEEFRPDIVLSDYKLPDFNGAAALEIMQRTHPEIPVVMVTGALADIDAVDLIHAGAKDYVLKDRLARLAPAVQRALSVEQGVRARKAAEKSLLESEAKFRALVETTSDWIWEIDEQTVYTYTSPQVVGLLGYSTAEIIGKTPFDLMPPDEAARIKEDFGALFAERKPFRLLGNTNLHKDGRTVFLETSGNPIFDAQGVFKGYRGIDRDITKRKQDELALESANRTLRTLSACNVALVRADNESDLLDSICRLIVEKGGYRMVWVGFPEHDPAATVRPVAQFGHDEGYLEAANISWADNERGRGPSGTAIRTGTVQVNQNFLVNPTLTPWREAAQLRGYQSSIALPLKSATGIVGALTIYASEPDTFNQAEVSLLQELADDLAFGIENLRTRAERDRIVHERLHYTEILRQGLEESIKAIANTVEMRDAYTAGHQRRVGQLAVAIARELKLPEETARGIELAASIHDLGKISVPAEILAKPAKLTAIEYMLIKNHAQAGFDILKDIKFPWPIATMVLQHHERLDGSGYPQGLKGDQILLESRIMAVSDVVDAMASHRPYRAALGIDFALKEIERGRGTAYDATVVDACVRLFAEKRFAFSDWLGSGRK